MQIPPVGQRGPWLAELLEAHGTWTNVARAIGIPRTTLNEWRQREDVPADVPLPIPVEHEQLIIEGDAGVSSDWHAPMLRYDVLHRFLDDCAREGLRRVICAGDLTTQDALANHEQKQRGAELDVELEHLNHAVSVTLDAVDELVVSLGNHDRHAHLRLGVSFERSIRMLLSDLSDEKLARIRVTARDSVIVRTERGPWLVCHTRSYSRQPLAYPNKLALRHGMHVAAGHRHHHAQGKSANGFDIVELGGFHDSERMTYVYRYTNDMPAMANGYGLLRGGFMRCPMLYS